MANARNAVIQKSLPARADALCLSREVRAFLRRSKDATLAFTARVASNSWLKGIGEMTELSIDTKKRRIRVRLELLGEAEPIEVEITKYNLKNKDSGEG